MKETTRVRAFEKAAEIIGAYSKDAEASTNAGYAVYAGTNGGYISDLGDRLEVTTADYNSINIWIEAETEQTSAETSEAPAKEEHTYTVVRFAHTTNSEESPIDCTFWKSIKGFEKALEKAMRYTSGLRFASFEIMDDETGKTVYEYTASSGEVYNAFTGQTAEPQQDAETETSADAETILKAIKAHNAERTYLELDAHKTYIKIVEITHIDRVICGNGRGYFNKYRVVCKICTGYIHYDVIVYKDGKTVVMYDHEEITADAVTKAIQHYTNAAKIADEKDAEMLADPTNTTKEKLFDLAYKAEFERLCYAVDLLYRYCKEKIEKDTCKKLVINEPEKVKDLLSRCKS